MTDTLPRLFRHSWGLASASFGTLASTMAVVAFVFRRIGRDAVHGSGYCAPPLPEGGEVYCTLGVALARIAGFLNFGAIVFAAFAFYAAWHWWSAPKADAAIGDAGAGRARGGAGDGD